MTDGAEIRSRMQAIYDGYLANEPADALLHPDVTIWDSGQFPLARGLAQLQELRARRPRDADAVRVTSLRTADPVVDVWGDTALLRHVLTVELSDGGREVVRNTSVWRRVDGEWLAVHNHEDVAGGGAAP